MKPFKDTMMQVQVYQVQVYQVYTRCIPGTRYHVSYRISPLGRVGCADVRTDLRRERPRH